MDEPGNRVTQVLVRQAHHIAKQDSQGTPPSPQPPRKLSKDARREIQKYLPVQGSRRPEPYNAHTTRHGIIEPVLCNPWKKYLAVCDILDFNGKVTLSAQKTDPDKLVNIRLFTDETGRTFQNYRQLRHENIVIMLESFKHDGKLFVVLEDMALPLKQVVNCPVYPTQRQLVAILRQVWWYLISETLC